MSGPKLMRVTTDPCVSLMNEIRLLAVGKVAYYSPLIDGVNVDINNEATWFERYATSIPKEVLGSGLDQNNTVRKELQYVQSVKNRYIREMKESVIYKEEVLQLSSIEINALLVKKIEMLPRKKERFIYEISDALRRLEEAIQEAKREEYEREQEKNRRREEAEFEIHSKLEEKNQAEKEQYQRLLNSRIGVKKTEETWDDLGLGEMRANSNEEEGSKEDRRPFPDFAERAKIEIIESDLEMTLKSETKSEEEQRQLEVLESDLEVLSSDDEFYSAKSKRVILKRLEMEYNTLNSMIASRKAYEADLMKERGALEAEYITYMNAFGKPVEDVSSIEVDELRSRTKEMREELIEMETRSYIEETITEVMEKMQYESVSTTSVSQTDGVMSVIFENNDDIHIRTSLNSENIMIEVVGDGEKEPTAAEIKKQVENQGELCRMYPQIKEELEKRFIHIDAEQCTPISPETAKNIPIARTKGKKKKKFRLSQVVAESVPSGKEEVQRLFEESDKNVRYMEEKT